MQVRFLSGASEKKGSEMYDPGWEDKRFSLTEFILRWFAIVLGLTVEESDKRKEVSDG